MADSNDVLVLVLKSIFFVRTVIWVIDKALIIRTEPITLMRGVNSSRSKNVEMLEDAKNNKTYNTILIPRLVINIVL